MNDFKMPSAYRDPGPTITTDGTAHPADELRAQLPNLWNAIVENTRGNAAFWLGEILLNEITKETGYTGPSR